MDVHNHALFDEGPPHGVPVLVVEAGQAQLGGVLGEREGVAALGRHPADLVGAEPRVPQDRERHRDEAVGVGAAPALDVPVVVGPGDGERQLLVVAVSEQATGE